MKSVPQRSSVTRELTDKKLSAMGDNVRFQSPEISNIIQENLKAAFAAHRLWQTEILIVYCLAPRSIFER